MDVPFLEGNHFQYQTIRALKMVTGENSPPFFSYNLNGFSPIIRLLKEGFNSNNFRMSSDKMRTLNRLITYYRGNAANILQEAIF